MKVIPPPPDVPFPDFDREDLETLREMLAEHRSRKAVREMLGTWGKYLTVGAAVLIALTQYRDTIRAWLGMTK